MKQFVEMWLIVVGVVLYVGFVAGVGFLVAQWNEWAAAFAVMLACSPAIAAWGLAMGEAQENRRKYLAGE